MKLNPKFPIVEGDHLIANDWKLHLPVRFNRRIEDGSLVIWRPGFTIWTSVWNNDKNESIEDRLKWIIDSASPEAYDKETEREATLTRYSYRLYEKSDDHRQSAFYCFAIGRKGQVEMAIYLDNPEDISMAKEIWRSSIEIQENG